MVLFLVWLMMGWTKCPASVLIGGVNKGLVGYDGGLVGLFVN